MFDLTGSTLRTRPHCRWTATKGKYQVAILKKQDDVSVGGTTTTSALETADDQVLTIDGVPRLQAPVKTVPAREQSLIEVGSMSCGSGR